MISVKPGVHPQLPKYKIVHIRDEYSLAGRNVNSIEVLSTRPILNHKFPPMSELFHTVIE